MPCEPPDQLFTLKLLNFKKEGKANRPLPWRGWDGGHADSLSARNGANVVVFKLRWTHPSDASGTVSAPQGGLRAGRAALREMTPDPRSDPALLSEGFRFTVLTSSLTAQ